MQRICVGDIVKYTPGRYATKYGTVVEVDTTAGSPPRARVKWAYHHHPASGRFYVDTKRTWVRVSALDVLDDDQRVDFEMHSQNLGKEPEGSIEETAEIPTEEWNRLGDSK